jgi:hypothetical protein
LKRGGPSGFLIVLSMRGSHAISTSFLMAVAPVSPESVVIDVVSSTKTQNWKVKGVIRGKAGKNLILLTEEEIPAFSSVALHSKDLIFMGEIVSSVPAGIANWATHVRVRRSLLVI